MFDRDCLSQPEYRCIGSIYRHPTGILEHMLTTSPSAKAEKHEATHQPGLLL